MTLAHAPVASHTHALIGAARAELAETAGFESCQRYAQRMDAVVADLFREAHASLGAALPPVALVALGGFGRGELGPYSDLDLLFLVGDGAPGPPEMRAFVEAVLFPLWDLKLEVGHGVRDVASSIALAREDLTAATSLLDARLVAGDARLYGALVERARAEIIEPDLGGFVDRLLHERAVRHARFGDSVYLLEPNLKSGQGGLRDLYSALWAAKARFGVTGFEDLVTAGGATARQAAALADARDFLWRVRFCAHLHARRRQDHLLFEVQEAIAPLLYPQATRPEHHDPVAPSVEELMRQYYLNARAVVREVDGLTERCRPPPSRAPRERPIDATFGEVAGEISVRDRETIRARPSEALRLFHLALDQGLRPSRQARDAVAEAVDAQPAALYGDRAAARLFVELLCDARDAASPSLLEEAHDMGILAALMPEFAPCTARAQHDIYHAYTVDQHSLYAVAHLKALARGEHARAHPLATEIIAEVARPISLYLGTLLHDVGKPFGSGHSAKGAALSEPIAVRFGLEEQDARRTEFLVLHHLRLAHISQRRDLSDPRLIERFARAVGDLETLRQLYLLTVADTAMTSPGNLTAWKQMLLDQLYTRARDALAPRRAIDVLAPGGDHRPREAVARILGGSPDAPALIEFFDSLPAHYFEQRDPAEIARDLRLARGRGCKAGTIATEVRHRSRHGYSELVLCCDDAPGVLARVAGVMLAHRIDIVGAHVHTRRGGDTAHGEALDVFQLRDRYGRAIRDPARWKRLVADLGDVLAGRRDVEQLVEHRLGGARAATMPPRATPKIATKVQVDNEASAELTVLDVFTQDRLGVLYAIARTLAELHLDIAFSRVSTEAERVADSFYVRDSTTGAKIVDETRLAHIRTTLVERLVTLRSPEALAQ
ncbi:MAG: [protein-PII] uridylyltransferase [Myxococcota bacterium]